MALTKTIIAEKIQNELNLSRTVAYDVMEEFLEIIKETIAGGEDIMISGFGKFCVNDKKERKGRNPATDEEMTLPARRVVTFKCSGKLRDSINSDA
ncbi:integration host factor subunit alpha [uncultured Desulfobacter sp.]|uniref:integration host factor subunit alpha n=1 Tax=uncultured Desulfobacter sp. TaxID=240139 RepID=UPI002AAA8192|nr:integration host factor subunit alpha [uncultured Desulfobacter sp.]